MCHAPGSPTAGQVDAIYQDLKGAEDAYAQAEAAITQAEEARLIMADEKELLTQANTPLVESQALQHTVDEAQIKAKTDESVGLSQQAQTAAEDALAGLDTRRVLLYVALAVILVTVVALILIKRELDRNLEARRARQRKSPS
jgi:hypothetical protein